MREEQTAETLVREIEYIKDERLFRRTNPW